jgi:hypothetical protein
VPGGLRYDALQRRASLRERMSGVSSDPRLVMGSTIAVLLLLGAAVFGTTLATGGLSDEGGAKLLVVCFLVAAGLAVLASALRDGGRRSVLARFAQDNDLHLIGSVAAPDYGGSLFADGSHVVHQSVRTRLRPLREVGDRYRYRAGGRYNPTTGGVQVAPPRTPQLFLRGQLSARVAVSGTVTPDGGLPFRIAALAGDHVVEVAGDEVTLFGSRPLAPHEPGRLQQAFALLDELVAWADAAHASTVTPSYGMDATPADEPLPRRGWRPATTVAATLLLIVLAPLGFVALGSILDSLSGSTAAANGALVVFAGLVSWLVVILLRRASGTGSDTGTPAQRRWRTTAIGAGTVAVVVALVVVASQVQDGGIIGAGAEKKPGACYADDPWSCPLQVSTQSWVDGHALLQLGTPDWQRCDLGAGDLQGTTCRVRVDCPDGGADLLLRYDDEPLGVVGASATRGSRGQTLVNTDDEVAQLVTEQCRPSDKSGS